MTTVLATRLPDDFAAAVRRAATESGRTVSDVIHESLIESLNDDGATAVNGDAVKTAEKEPYDAHDIRS